MAPHNAAGPALDVRVVQRVKRALRICDAVKVYISIAQGAARNSVAAHSDGCHRPNYAEYLIKLRFCDILGKLTDVERGELRDTRS